MRLARGERQRRTQGWFHRGAGEQRSGGCRGPVVDQGRQGVSGHFFLGEGRSGGTPKTFIRGQLAFGSEPVAVTPGPWRCSRRPGDVPGNGSNEKSRDRSCGVGVTGAALGLCAWPAPSCGVSPIDAKVVRGRVGISAQGGCRVGQCQPDSARPPAPRAREGESPVLVWVVFAGRRFDA